MRNQKRSKKRLGDLSVEYNTSVVKCGICKSTDTVKQKLVYCEECGNFELDYSYNLDICPECDTDYSSMMVNLCMSCFAYEWHKCPECDKMMWFCYHNNKISCKCL